MKRISFLMILFILLLSISIGTSTDVQASSPSVKDAERAIVLADQEENTINVYDNIGDNSAKTTLPTDTEVHKLKEEKQFSLIRYEIDNHSEEGYVKTEYIVVEENDSEVNDAENIVEENDDETDKAAKASDAKDPEKTSDKKLRSASVKNPETVNGTALKQPTYIYQSESQQSTQLKSYKKGTRLKYKLTNDDWYEATVKVDNKWKKGYIYSADVDHSNKIEVQTLHGFAMKDSTNVYKTAGESNVANAEVLKSYPIGSKLKYRTHNDNWYAATVKADNKWQTGYIRKNDVDVKKPTLQGYAQQNKTAVYQSTSRSSKALKSYLQGHLLKYKPHNATWYEATVIINRKRQTGYIHKDDVGSKQVSLQGYAQQEMTGVYAGTSKESSVLKQYPAGHLLKYKEHNGTWFKATVKIGAKWETGYIHKNDVGLTVPSFEGYAQHEATVVYDATSKSSKVLKSYPAGSTLKYRPYNGSWYEATVYLSGTKHIGYIHADQIAETIPTLTGFANKTSTAVYNSTSRNAQVLKTYSENSMLKYKPYNNSWYKATVYLKGNKYTGYIHKNDVLKPVGKTVVIDAGHGGRDSGASANGIREKDVTLEISKKTARELENSGFNVIMTRSTDEYLALHERTRTANNANAHLFLSIHVNAGGGRGIETWWYSKGPQATDSKQFAADIQSEVIKETRTTNRGIKDGNLHVNRESNMPSALIETGFVDNNDDAKKLKQNSYKNSIAKGIVQGIKKFFKIP